jgi:hypothetical protein
MNVIIGYAAIYGLGAFGAGFAISELWRMDRPAEPQQYTSGRCICGRPFDDCNHPITHGIRR